MTTPRKPKADIIEQMFNEVMLGQVRFVDEGAPVIQEEKEPSCKSCGIPFTDHLGLEGTCKQLCELRASSADGSTARTVLPPSAVGAPVDQGDNDRLPWQASALRSCGINPASLQGSMIREQFNVLMDRIESLESQLHASQERESKMLEVLKDVMNCGTAEMEKYPVLFWYVQRVQRYLSSLS